MLFFQPADIPAGFVYHADIVTEAEERALLAGMATVAFGDVRMRGQVARRRTAHFGWTYGYETWRVEPGPPIPAFLGALRERAARLAGVHAEALAEVLVTHYPPGAGIGWHRDAPAFGLVVGASLLGACRFRFQQGRGAARRTRAVELAPRSAYVLDGPARWQWQHAIPPGRAERYSVTFRTLAVRAAGRRGAGVPPSEASG
jgi:alkylated DNA repair dioxygenase AlkB